MFVDGRPALQVDDVGIHADWVHVIEGGQPRTDDDQQNDVNGDDAAR